MINRKSLISIVFFVLIATFAFGQKQGLVHPWMLFNSSDINAIKAKLLVPSNAKMYKSLGSGSGLKYALYGDMSDLASVKTNCYYPTLGARVRMKAGDSQGSFQWGRRMQDWLIPLSLIINTSSFSAQEVARLRLSCDSIAWRLRDPSYVESGVGSINNRTLDELMGVAFAGVFMFPDNPNASNHYTYVVTELNRQLGYVKEDGAWPETSRYVGQVIIKCLVLFSQVQRNYLGNNLGLISDPRFRSILKCFLQTACPKDKLDRNRRNAPAVGDSGWGEANFQAFAWAAAEISRVDPELAKQLQGMWKMTGAEYLNNGNCYSYQLAVADVEAPCDSTFILPSVIQKNIGYSIFRNDYGKPTESYLITHLPDRNYYHRHYDCGSFSLFANNTPLMLDAGVGEYAEPDVSFYKSTLNHNVVSFKDVNGLDVNGLDVGATIVDTLLSADYDFVSANITPPNSISNKYIRNTGYLKSVFNSVLIFDYVDSNIGRLHSNNLHTFTTSTDLVTRNGFNRTISHGYNNLDIEMTHLLSSYSITFSKNTFHAIDIPKAWPRNLANTKDAGDLGNCYQEWISVNNTGRNHYLTVIRPKDKTEQESFITSLTVDNANCKGFKVSVPGKGSYMILINISSTVQTTSVQWDTNTNLVSMRNKIKYTMDSSGKFSVGIPAMSMDVFMTNDFLSDTNAVVSQSIINIQPSISKGIYEIVGDCVGANYSVFNLAGQTLLSGKVVHSHQAIDISSHPQGTYLVRILKDKQTEVKKIIKF